MVLRKQMLLVCLKSNGLGELPGFVIAKTKTVITHFNEVLFQMSLTERPQQSLYLSEVALTWDRKKKATGLVRIIQVHKELQIDLPTCKYQPLKLIEEDENAIGLTKATVHWLNCVI